MTRPEHIDYHLGRLLLLLRHFAPVQASPLIGLTKLAKLDFLLRYPAFTDRLLVTRNLPWPLDAFPTDAEINAVESRMIRYKYGPWDDRYYPLLGALVGLGLAQVSQRSNALTVQLTNEGTVRASRLAATSEWTRVDSRAQMLKERFDLSGTRLKNVIYSELPDAVDRPHRSEI